MSDMTARARELEVVNFFNQWIAENYVQKFAGQPVLEINSADALKMLKAFAAQSAAPVEEVARELVFHFGVQGSMMSYETVLEFLRQHGYGAQAHHPNCVTQASYIAKYSRPDLRLIIEELSQLMFDVQSLHPDNVQKRIKGICDKLDKLAASPTGRAEPPDRYDELQRKGCLVGCYWNTLDSPNQWIEHVDGCPNKSQVEPAASEPSAEQFYKSDITLPSIDKIYQRQTFRFAEAYAAHVTKGLREEYERLQRTVAFMEKTYLEQHGGSWGLCKYQAEAAGLREQLDLRNMVLDLTATNDLFVQPAEGGGWVFWVNVNDMFYPASDGEGVDLSEIPAVWKTWKEKDWLGVVRWVQEKRGGLKLRKSREERILSIENLQKQLDTAREAAVNAVDTGEANWRKGDCLENGCACWTEHVKAAIMAALVPAKEGCANGN